jgi:hypothetical protein
MKTVEEVVEECGFPVYVEVLSRDGSKSSAILHEDCGQYSLYMSYNWCVDRVGSTGSMYYCVGYFHRLEKVQYYETFEESHCSLSNEQAVPVNNVKECTCISLLNGHSNDCSYAK